jgi:drug/metabolite transporter (DMT)-like permease
MCPIVPARAFKTGLGVGAEDAVVRTYMSLVLVMAFWGSAFPSSKIAVQSAPPEVAAFIRFLLGAAVLVALGGAQRLPVRDLAAVAGLGVVGVFGYNVLFFAALTLAPAADGSVIVPVTAPVITVVVTAVLGRRRLAARTALGLVAAVAGGAVFLAGIPAGGGERFAGDLVFIAGAACWAVYTICGAPVLRRLPAFTVTTYATLAGALALGVFALPSFGELRWSELDTGFWLNQVYLSVLPTALAYVMYYQAVRRVGPAVSSSAMFLVPVFGLACSWLLLGESITIVQATGAVFMLSGAWLANLGQSGRHDQPRRPVRLPRPASLWAAGFRRARARRPVLPVRR